MTEHIRICPNCRKYTLEEECVVCKVSTVLAKPPKYSPSDKYANYRREAKAEERKGKGLY